MRPKDIIHKIKLHKEILSLGIEFIALIGLLANLYWFQKQNTLMQQEIDIAQSLNQPLPAIKEFKITNKTPDIFLFSVVIKNFGNYVAENVYFNWETVLLTSFQTEARKVEKKVPGLSSTFPKILTLLPQHEFELPFKYISREDIKKMIDGSERAIETKFTIEFTDLHKIRKTFVTIYGVTNMLRNELFDITVKEISFPNGQPSI